MPSLQSNIEIPYSIYNGNLHQLPSGVFTSGYSDVELNKYIHGIFNSMEGAESYAKRHQQHHYFRHHINRALSKINETPKENSLILDIGSGSGNTVIPSLELFPNSKIIATDLSEYLLAILKKSNNDGRIVAIQENAEELNFKTEVFDYVIGGAILHHLFYPNKTIEQTINVLKPGGTSIFFEPCASGQRLVKIGYEKVLEDKRSETLEPRVLKLLKQQISFIDVRLRNRPDLKPEVFKNLEDKWIFPKQYLRDIAENAGAQKVYITPLDSPLNLVRQKMESNFRILNTEVPPWVAEIARDFDASMSDDFKIENPAAVTVMFRKSPLTRSTFIPKNPPNEMHRKPSTIDDGEKENASAKNLIVVYQYGKVGSSALIKTFNNTRDTTAIQSHFLGEKHLTNALKATINPNTSPYFFQHRYGQLIENIKTTHRINSHKNQTIKDEKLDIITLTRDPVTWFQSCILQDIEGYLPFFRKLAVHLGHSSHNDHHAVVYGLHYFFQKAERMLSRIDNLDLFLQGNRQLDNLSETQDLNWIDNNIKMFFNLMIRPNTWFNDHLMEYLDVDITKMDLVEEGWFRYNLGWSKLYMIKYEMLGKAFQGVAEDIGLPGRIELETENVSESKAYAEAVKEGFDCDEARNIARIIRSTELQKFLGYSD